MRAIDADALLKRVQQEEIQAQVHGREFSTCFLSPGGTPSTEWWYVEDLIENAPTVELKLIYCKDCVRKCTFRETQGPGGYCRYGRDKDWNLNPQMRGDTDEQNNESYL